METGTSESMASVTMKRSVTVKKKKPTGVKKKNAKKKNESTPFQCTVCSKAFNDKYALATHVQIHTTALPFACALCPFRCKVRKYLARHVRRAHGAPPSEPCDLCGKQFYHRSKMLHHRRVHTGEKPYKCSVCGRAFSALYSLNTHKLIHTNEKPFQCSFCEYACRDSSTLRKHQQRHMGTEKVYECKMCGEKYKSKWRLKHHVAEKHLSLDVRKHACTECDKCFKLKSQLTNHIRTVHEKSTRCRCELCGVELSHRSNLAAHMRVHVDERPYVCTFDGCGKRFKDSSSLKKHGVLHYPSQHQQCATCGATFPRPARLRAHLAVHMPRHKRHQCDHCGKRFYNKNYVAKHIREKHTGPGKRYQCDLCGFITRNKPSIVMHIKHGHVSESDRECTICHTIYKRHAYLKAHYARSHGITYKTRTRMKPVEIKEEPPDYDDDEVSIDLLEIEKEEILEGHPSPPQEAQDPPEDTTEQDPMKKDIGDPVKELIANHRKELNKVPEAVFNDHYIQCFAMKPGETIQRNPKEHIDRKSQQHANMCVKRLLGKVRRIEEVDTLERTRQVYNDRIRFAVKGVKKETVEIKYYNKNKPKDVARSISKIIKVNHESTDKDLNVIDKRNVKLLPSETHHENKKNGAINKNDGAQVRDIAVKKAVVVEKDIVDNTSEGKARDIVVENAVVRKDVVNKRSEAEVRDVAVEKVVVIKKVSEIINQDASDKSMANFGANDEGKANKDLNSVQDETKEKDINIEYDGIQETDSTTDRKEENENLTSPKDPEEKALIKHTDDGNDVVATASEENCNNDKVVPNEADITDGGNVIIKNKRSRRKAASKKKYYNDSDGTNDEESDIARKGRKKIVKTKSGKIKFNTHQCYICFKLFETKDQLVDHCKDHFDVCTNVSLKKCPFCDYVTKASINKHVRIMHNINIKVLYGKIRDNKHNTSHSRYYYEFKNNDSKELKQMEIIPSIRNLNKMAYVKIDRKNREERDKVIAKPKLVRKGKEWIVEREKINVTPDDFVLPEFDSDDVKLNKETGVNDQLSDDYVDKMKRLSKLMKKNGKKMLFPCDRCEKICQTVAALKLHSRKHALNPKPFKKKVWKHKMKKDANVTKEQTDTTVKVNPFNREAKPKPIKNKHKCDPELKKFYEKNITGGDVEFWQFLKIFNKMDRENITDFGELESRTDFGLHPNNEAIDDVDSVKVDLNDKANDNVVKGDVTNKKDRLKVKRKVAFRRVIGLSKKEYLRRNAIKKKLRDAIAVNTQA